ncbi:MAG: oxidoreductase, partial [Comamonadaceae bacterium]
PPGDARPRDYSIASIARDGRIHLLVRLERRDDGTPGAASGWLCGGLAIGGSATLRIRPHPNFRLQQNAKRPLVFIGNGSGLAGLRGHLRARALDGAGPNWLVFGERSRTHDFLHREEIEAWQAGGLLQRVDLAFSRDQSDRIYVQHLLAAVGDTLKAWVDDGAAIYVCGSLKGMAQAVDAVLAHVFGPDLFDVLQQEGRIRRDVY